MKILIFNKIPEYEKFLIHYLKQNSNFFLINYKNEKSFKIKPERAILVSKTKEPLFEEECKKNGVFLTVITDNPHLKTGDLSFFIRMSGEANNTNPHLAFPKIVKWVVKRKTGNYIFLNDERKEHINYIKPSQEADFPLSKAIDKKTVNIYTPTYYRYEKTKKSIENIVKLASESKYDMKVFIGDNNTKDVEMKEWLATLNEVYFSPKNIGKANIVNLLHRQSRKCDYIFSIDSDMYSDVSEYNTFDKMIEILDNCFNVGLVSSNQKECSQHWFDRTVFPKKNNGFDLGYSNNGIGVAGGCIAMRCGDWEKSGGYKEDHDIYTGDDSILTYNVGRKLCMDPVVAIDYYMVHPKPTPSEMGYTEWKTKSWQRDNVQFVKDNYKGTNTKGYYD
jgi:hypothetical protein